MTAQVSELEIMDEDRLVEEVLDRFVNCHEQTYEEFLSTFTHLSKEDNGTNRRAFGTDYSENILTSVKPICENEPKDQNLRKRDIFLCTSSQWSEEEQADNFLDLEDLDLDEEIKPQMNEGWLLLPGEVEQQVNACVPSYIPSVAQPVTPGVKPRHAANGAGKQMDKILGDEVQPFSLDEEFDYDTVLLTPKFTPAETDAIKELSKQKRKNSDTGVEEPCD
ncbi:intraflagellar transport-associated protein isoform X5 [Manis pentadactyla]|uniref:intraflagellar transport-associated protein isoform X5 n=1 Tax=Manis pentadactyla TaxID=143292 RepID=UPI00255C5FDE|nr:intraflagellar transport-associated protein isoform X5 [Manis pentadactyla]